MTEPGSFFFNVRARGDWVRLRTLVVLRWMAIAGQAVAVLVATQLMDFRLHLPLCALVISASVSFNIVAHVVNPAEKRLSERGTLFSLYFDLLQLVTLLILTGGLNNPFAVLIIAPVTIAATALRLQSTVWLGVTALVSIPLMATVYLPLVQADGTVLVVPDLFRYGIAAALAIGLVFLGLYSRRVTVEGYAMSEALNATQMALAREQRLSAIGGIAAATAHELGTPLATIKLVAGEMSSEVDEESDLAADVSLIKSEAERCAAILADLGEGARDDSHVKQAPISSVIEEAARPHAKRGKALFTRIGGVPTDEYSDEQPLVGRSPELIHGLRNAIQNAVDYAQHNVWIDISLTKTSLRIAVGDDGPGFSPDILPRLGEPYVSTRSRAARSAGANHDGSEYQGMGLGLFIARMLLEQTGAVIAFANGSDAWGRKSDEGAGEARYMRPPGAVTQMTWPLDALVVSKNESRRALGRNKRFQT